MSDVMGLDLSLTATGIATEKDVFVLKTPATKMDGVPRLLHIRGEVLAEAGRLGDPVVFLEGYSFNSKQGGERIGELGGVIRVMLFEQGIPVVEVQPKTLKKFATGNGNAGKDWMIAEAVRRAPAEVVIRDNNAADAWWLYVLGNAVMGLPILSLPQKHTSALSVLSPPLIAGLSRDL